MASPQRLALGALSLGFAIAAAPSMAMAQSATNPGTGAQGPAGATVRGPDGSGARQGSGSQILDQMKGDLRRLVSSNEVYRAKNGKFSNSTAALQGYRASSGITVTITTASANGWAAEATAQGLPGKSCVIFIGSVTTPLTTTADHRSSSEAVVACDHP